MKIYILSAMAILPISFVANGQNVSVEQNDSLTSMLEEVEIVANRANSKTPVAYTNVSKRELLKTNDGRDMTYLLKMTPSVTTTSDAVPEWGIPPCGYVVRMVRV